MLFSTIWIHFFFSKILLAKCSQVSTNDRKLLQLLAAGTAGVGGDHDYDGDGIGIGCCSSFLL